MRAACFLLVTALALAQDQSGGITGQVVDAVTHLPVKTASVLAIPRNIMSLVRGQSNTGRNTGPPSGTTDAAGMFTILNAPPGEYRLSVTHQSYSQSPGGVALKTIEVMAGAVAGPVTLEMMPPASVSGHVVDEDGDPLTGCQVTLRVGGSVNQNGPLRSATSQEDGGYRIYGVSPGKYAIAALCQAPIFQPRPLSSGPDPASSLAYPMQFYPATTEAARAAVVELTGGSETAGIDFQMRPSRVTQVRGTFSPAGADWHGQNNLTLQLLPADLSNPDEMTNPAIRPAARIDQAKGAFEFRDVFPGSYILIAASPGGEPDSRIGGFARMDVSDTPVTAVIELRKPMDINGTIEIEDNGGNPLRLDQIQIGIRPAYPVAGSGPPARVNDDGRFTLKSVNPGLSRLNVNAPSAFLKAAWLGTTDVMNVPVDLSAGAGALLRIVMSTRTATIRGTAPAGGVIYAQQIAEGPGASIRSTAVDQNGQFVVQGLGPGKYRVIQTYLPGAIPTEGGQQITVSEGETVTVDLRTASTSP